MKGLRRGPGPYADRSAAGKTLAAELGDYAGRDDVVVLGLPRGGVPVAAEVAAALAAPLDVLVVRKIGVPGQSELAMGAVAGIGDAVEVVRNEHVIAQARVSDADFEAAGRREIAELQRREHRYRGGRARVPVAGRVVVLVDDGLATGATMRAAVAAVRGPGPARVVVAVPIGAPESCVALAEDADEVVCPWTPEQFWAVGQGYRDFSPTADDDVRRLLSSAA